MSRDPVRVFVIADIRLYRDGLARCLATEPNIEVVGAAADGEDAVDRLIATGAELALLDMAAANGVRTARAIHAGAPDARVLALAVPDTESHMLTCAEAGIAGYVPHDGSYDDLVSAVERIARGEAVCSPHVVAGLLRRVAAGWPQARNGDGPTLTRRELQILALIDEGKSNKEIASALSIELPTVKNHVHHILEKLQVRRRAEAVALVRRNGTLRPGT